MVFKSAVQSVVFISSVGLIMININFRKKKIMDV